MTRHPGRAGYAWRQVRQRMLDEYPVCVVCGRPGRFDDPLEVDHFPVSIEMMERMGMPMAEQRSLALDKHNLRVIHRSLNRSLGDHIPSTSAPRKQPAKRWSRDWGGGNHPELQIFQ